MSVSETKLFRPEDFQFLDLSDQLRRRRAELHRSPVGYDRLGGAGLERKAGLGMALADAGQRGAGLLNAADVSRIMASRQANAENEAMIRGGMNRGIASMVKPGMSLGLKLFRDKIQKDEQLQSLYSKHSSDYYGTDY